MKTFSALIALALVASLCPRAPTAFTRCRPALVPQTGSEKRRNGEALKISYEITSSGD
jgi:hypothetical protein